MEIARNVISESDGSAPPALSTTALSVLEQWMYNERLLHKPLDIFKLTDRVLPSHMTCYQTPVSETVSDLGLDDRWTFANPLYVKNDWETSPTLKTLKWFTENGRVVVRQTKSQRIMRVRPLTVPLTLESIITDALSTRAQPNEISQSVSRWH